MDYIIDRPASQSSHQCWYCSTTTPRECKATPPVPVHIPAVCNRPVTQVWCKSTMRMAPIGESSGSDDCCELHLGVKRIQCRLYFFTYVIVLWNNSNPEFNNITYIIRNKIAVSLSYGSQAFGAVTASFSKGFGWNLFVTWFWDQVFGSPKLKIPVTLHEKDAVTCDHR